MLGPVLPAFYRYLRITTKDLTLTLRHWCQIPYTDTELTLPWATLT